MGNNKKHGTASASPTQVAEIFSAFMKAMAIIINDFSAKELINAVKNNCEKLAGIMWLVFTLLVTGQILALNSEPKSEFATWRTINLGTFKKVELLIDAIKKLGYWVCDWAIDTMGKEAFKLSEVKAELELVRVSVAELGFKKGAKLKDIFARAFEFGLILCPGEVGPQLRLQYTDQPICECLVVAMEAISGSDGDLNLFNVICGGDGAMWLITYYGNPDYDYDPDDMFVFARSM